MIVAAQKETAVMAKTKEELTARLSELDDLIHEAANQSRAAQDRFKDLQQERMDVQAEIIATLKKQMG